MGMTRRFLAVLALGGAVAGIAIGVAQLIHEPAQVDIHASDLSRLDRVITITIPDECLTATSPTPRCTRAWEANRIHFFGQQAQPTAKAGSGEGGRP